jgi:hypothetical protein
MNISLMIYVSAFNGRTPRACSGMASVWSVDLLLLELRHQGGGRSID